MTENPASHEASLSLSQASTLVDLLRWRAAHEPEKPAYVYLKDGTTLECQLNYATLDHQVRSLASRLQQCAQPGDRALLAYSEGLDVVIALWACLYAGVIAVPVPPPDPLRARQSLPRLKSILHDAGTDLLLASSNIIAALRPLSAELGMPADARWIDSALLSPEWADQWITPPQNAEAVAYLQYTSGSTSDPKGVMVTHGNLMHHCAIVCRAAGLDQESRSLTWLPYFHDYGLAHGLIIPLFAGIPSYLMSPLAFLRRPVKWLEGISHHRITHSGGPNFAYDHCVRRTSEAQRASLDLRAWMVASCGAEPIRASTVNDFVKAFEPAGFKPDAFAPAYGMAEFTLVASLKDRSQHPVIARLQSHALEQGIVAAAETHDTVVRSIVGCGVPAGDTRVAIVDPQTKRRCPPDGIGEIWLAGESRAGGYWNRPEESDRTFRAELADPGEGPFLRTGDLGFVENGQVFVTGRLKDLLIVRGRNYYPQDIELTVEQAHPALRQNGGAAFSIEGPMEEQLVVVQEVSRKSGHFNCEEIASAIRHAVADHHDLHVFDVVLIKPGSLLKTSSGKVQRGACRSAYLSDALAVVGRSRMEPLSLEPIAESPTRDQLLAMPAGDRSRVLADHFQRVIAKSVGRAPITLALDQPLNALGLDSLRAVSLKNQLEDALGFAVPLSTLLQGATVIALVNQILASLSEQGANERAVPPIVPVPRDRALPLSYSQQRMWFMNRLAPESTAYNMPVAIHLTGPLKRMALEHAANVMIERYESFRTTFAMTTEGPVQIIGPPQAARWDVADLRQLPAISRMEEAARLVVEDARRPFDLLNGPLVRYILIQIEDEQHILLLNMHHIIGDQWSFAIIGQEFAALYNDYCKGRAALPAPSGIQYADFAVWQRQWLNAEVLRDQLSFWRTRLAGLSVLALPTDYPRPRTQRFTGSQRSVDLTDELLEALTQIAAPRGCTLFMTLLAAFKILLSRYAGQWDIAVGVPIANRTRLSTEGMVGTFVNTLVMRTDLSGDPTFEDLLDRVRETAFGAYDHQDLPFERLVEELVTERELSYSPLVQVLFNLTNVPMGKPEFEGLSWAPFEFDGGTAQFDLTIAVDTELTKKAYVAFRTDLFDASTIERMVVQYRALLEAIAADPRRNISAYSILSQYDQHCLLQVWNRTKAEYPSTKVLPELIAEQVARTPDSIAASMDGQTITYRELDAQSNRLARYLLRLGGHRGVTVGICLERSLTMLVSLLGIMKAGAAYVPLDPDYPRDRLKFEVEDSGSRLLVTSSPLCDRLPHEGRTVVNVDREWEAICREDATASEGPGPADLAYVIYTSGSTGKPKGVEIRHQSLVNLLWSMRMVPGCTQGDVLLSVTTLSFDIAGLELYLPLIVGGRVELVSRQVASDGRLLLKRMEECRPGLMQATPATWRMLIESGWESASHLTVLCGGEALPKDLADQILDRAGALWNMYGPTETTIWSTVSKIERGDSEITIGRPIANTQLYILDTLCRPVPVGVPGELYIGGDGLAAGYRDRSRLTAERFIPHPFSDRPDARLYKTGDLVRYRTDGRLVHLGRLDHQVKIRGFRIELGEIEAVLGAHTSVRQSVVVARPDHSGIQQLIAYVVPADACCPSGRELRTFLQNSLPDYMIPAQFTTMESFPLTANGKVDVLALPDPVWASPKGQERSTEPRTLIQIQLAALWQQVLGVSDIGLQDNFFELGGHSLMAVQLFAQIEQVFGKQLPLATLFEAPTIAQLADVLAAENWVPPWRSLVAIQPGGTARPLFVVPGIGGNVLTFAKLANLLGREQPFYGLQAKGLDGKESPFTSVGAMAAQYIAEVQAIQPAGPYVIGGTCTGGVIAYEMAQQLMGQREEVILLIMESWHPLSYNRYRFWLRRKFWPVVYVWGRVLQFVAKSQRMSAGDRVRLAASKLLERVKRVSQHPGGPLFGINLTNRRVAEATLEAIAFYEAREYRGTLLNVIASARALNESVVDTRRVWEFLARGESVFASIPAPDSGQLFVSPHVEQLADTLRRYLRQESACANNGVEHVEHGRRDGLSIRPRGG